MRTQKYFACLWIFALLTATTGIPVRKIYCYCLGQTTVSLFAMADACQADREAEAAACCKKERPSCCESSVGTGKTQDCTKKSTRVFQLKTEFLVDKPFEKSFPAPFWLPAGEPLFTGVAGPVFSCAEPSNKAPPEPPPPCPGRILCLRYQLFRC